VDFSEMGDYQPSFETDFGVVFETFLTNQWVNSIVNYDGTHIKHIVFDTSKDQLRKELKNVFEILRTDVSPKSSILFLSTQSHDRILAIPVNHTQLVPGVSGHNVKVDFTPNFNISVLHFVMRECLQLLSNIASPELILKRIVFVFDDSQILTKGVEVIQKALYGNNDNDKSMTPDNSIPMHISRHRQQNLNKSTMIPKCTTFDYLSHQLKPNDALSYRAAGVLLTRINRRTGQREVLLGRDSGCNDELSFLVCYTNFIMIY
jgi:hypothetical protein